MQFLLLHFLFLSLSLSILHNKMQREFAQFQTSIRISRANLEISTARAAGKFAAPFYRVPASRFRNGGASMEPQWRAKIAQLCVFFSPART